jgi:hypothetical protein
MDRLLINTHWAKTRDGFHLLGSSNHIKLQRVLHTYSKEESGFYRPLLVLNFPLCTYVILGHSPPPVLAIPGWAHGSVYPAFFLYPDRYQASYQWPDRALTTQPGGGTGKQM